MQFTPSGFAALLKPPTFKGVQYKRWRTRAIYLFQIMYCYDATKGKHEGDLNPTQQEAFQNMDTLFKAALLSVLDDSIVDSYMLFDSSKDMWVALEATFGPSGTGNELYVMEQFCDYKMTNERSVVQQTHEIQSMAKELEYFKCVLSDKFVVGTIIAKLPPSWNNFATFLKHKRHEFSVADLIGTLDVEEKARAKDTRARVAEGGLVPTWYRRRTPSPTSTKIIRTKLRAKASLIQRTSHHILPTSRRILIRRGRDFAMSAVILITGLQSVLTALRSANMRRAASPLMLSSVILI